MINPVLSLWINLIIFIILGIGLLIEIILATLYWEKLPRFFKKNLDAVPWALKDVLRICIGLLFIYLTINLFAYLTYKLNPFFREELKPIINIIGSLSIYGLGIWFVVDFIRTNYRHGIRFLYLKWKFSLKRSIQGILLYLGFIPILMFLTFIGLVFCSLFGIKPEPHPIIDVLRKEKSVFFIAYLIIAATVIAPVFEEILFRGLFYQTLKKQMGFLRAALISSSFFSLLHFNPAQFLPVLGLGTLFCFVFEYTGSLIPAIILHIFNNGLFLGLFFLLKEYL